MTNVSAEAEPATPWRGFHHVAMMTPDIDSTARFYAEVLGMTVGEVFASSKRGAGRNCFVYPDPANANGTMGIHFFEDTDAASTEGSAEPWGRGPGSGAVHHVAFALAGAEEASGLRARLQETGAWTSDVIDFGATESLLLRDDNGLMLEATWPKP